MGLDMYLRAEKYVNGWKHSDESERAEFSNVLAAVGLNMADIDESTPSGYVKINVAYWRKANAIHKWFVDNVQDGDDECQSSDVSRKQLQALVDVCKQVLSSIETVEGDVPTGTTYHPDGRIEHHTKHGVLVAQAGIAQALLPTQDGFFFGDTGYNEYYLEDLRITIKQIEKVLNNPKFADWSFEYRASW